VTRVITEQSVRAVIIEEVEYLSILNGEDALRRFLQTLDGASRRVGARIWIPVVPELLGPGRPDRLVDFRAAGSNST